VADAGLLAQDEDPRAYGFDPARLRWSAAGLALYDRDPALRASLALGAPPAGQFHPRYPGALDIQVDAGSARIGEQVMRWPAGLREATIELDVASLQPQTLRAGGVALDVPAGASSAALAVPLGQAVRVSADGGAVVLRVRVRSGGAAPAGRAYAAAVASQGSFDGERLTLQVAAGGPGDILLEAQGAAASDDHPVHLFRGALPRSDGAQAVSVALNVLQPEAPWIDQQAPAEDGRYIAYLRDAARPGAPGLPVAQWSVRAGRVVDARVVPLPLTELR
jgi:hypothetical protein